MKAGLVLLLAMLAVPANPVRAEDTAPAFAPANEPLLLTHSNRRTLFDGQRIVVSRTWRITLHRDGTGWIVDGQPAGTAIEAPPSLTPLARLEMARAPAGIFPFRLSAGGLIAEGAPGGPTADERAFAKAIELIRRAAAEQGHSSESRAFLEQVAPLAAGPIRAQWPAALFDCRESSALTEEFTLPGGLTGQFRSEITCSAGGNNLPASVVRRVTTIIGDSGRESEEQWTFGKP